MQSRVEHFQLAEKLFRDVVQHLQDRIARLTGGYGVDPDMDSDLAADELPTADQSTVTALRLEVCLYSLCLDWVHQQRTDTEGVADDARRHARENFFRLMGTVAQAELARDAHARSFGFSNQQIEQAPLSDAQMFTALEGTAERQLAALIAM